VGSIIAPAVGADWHSQIGDHLGIRPERRWIVRMHSLLREGVDHTGCAGKRTQSKPGERIHDLGLPKRIGI
jgi:hypothetical protein